MVEQVTFQTIFQFLQTVGILVAVFYYVMTIRANQRNQELALKAQKHAAETRQAQLYMQLYSFYDNKEFLKDYGNIYNVYAYDDIKDWNERYSAQVDNEAYSSWLRVGRFLDGVGILLMRNLIEGPLIFDLLGDVIQGAWEGGGDKLGMERFVKEGRRFWDRPKLWQNYEYLYEEYMKYLDEHAELKT
jgi:hypothetical protein